MTDALTDASTDASTGAAGSVASDAGAVTAAPTGPTVYRALAPRPRAVLKAALMRTWAAPWTAVGLALALAALAGGARWRVVDGVVEVSGGRVGAWASRGVGPFGVVALTLGHVVLAATPELMAALRVHERVHVAQYGRWGPLFVPAYLLAGAWAMLRGRDVYRGNAFERPAFAAEAATRSVSVAGPGPHAPRPA